MEAVLALINWVFQLVLEFWATGLVTEYLEVLDVTEQPVVSGLGQGECFLKILAREEDGVRTELDFGLVLGLLLLLLLLELGRNVGLVLLGEGGMARLAGTTLLGPFLSGLRLAPRDFLLRRA